MIYSEGQKIGSLYIDGQKIARAYQDGQLVWQREREVQNITEIYLEKPTWALMSRLYLESALKSVSNASATGYIDFSVAGRNVRARGAGGALKGALDSNFDFSLRLTLPSEMKLTTADLSVGDKLTFQISSPAVTGTPVYQDEYKFSKSLLIFEDTPFLPNSKLLLTPIILSKLNTWKVNLTLNARGTSTNPPVSKQFSRHSESVIGWDVEFSEEDARNAMSYLANNDPLCPTFWVERLSGSSLIDGVKLYTPALKYTGSLKIVKITTS